MLGWSSVVILINPFKAQLEIFASPYRSFRSSDLNFWNNRSLDFDLSLIEISIPAPLIHLPVPTECCTIFYDFFVTSCASGWSLLPSMIRKSLHTLGYTISTGRRRKFKISFGIRNELVFPLDCQWPFGRRWFFARTPRKRVKRVNAFRNTEFRANL